VTAPTCRPDSCLSGLGTRTVVSTAAHVNQNLRLRESRSWLAWPKPGPPPERPGRRTLRGLESSRAGSTQRRTPQSHRERFESIVSRAALSSDSRGAFERRSARLPRSPTPRESTGRRRSSYPPRNAGELDVSRDRERLPRGSCPQDFPMPARPCGRPASASWNPNCR
jgi:hypothetical protein